MFASGVLCLQLGGLAGDVLGMPGVVTNIEENQRAFRLGLVGIGPMAGEQRAPVKVPSTSPSIRDGIRRDYADACCKGPPSISWPTRMTRSRSRSPRRLIADTVDAEGHEAMMARFRKTTKAARANGVSEPHTPSLIRGRSVSLPGGDDGGVPTTLTKAVRPEHPGPASLPGPARLPVALISTLAPLQIVAASPVARASKPPSSAPDAVALAPALPTAPTPAKMKVVESLPLNSPDVEIEEEQLDFESAPPESVAPDSATLVGPVEPQQ